MNCAPSPCRTVGGLEPAGTPTSRNAVAALVQEEQVADAGEVRREAGERARHRIVRIGVAGDEHVRPPVAVHVGDGRAGVPAAIRAASVCSVNVPCRCSRAVDAGRRRDDEVGVAVAVEVGRDAAVALRPAGPRASSRSRSRNCPWTFSKSRLVGSPPCASHRDVSALAYELTANRSSQPSPL